MFLVKLIETSIVNSLWARSSSKGMKKLALLYAGVFIADRISQNDGKPLTSGLWKCKCISMSLWKRMLE